MQKIAESLNAKLEVCFPFIDNFLGFSKDLTYKSQKKDFTIPVGCNLDPDDCDQSEIEYMLPESRKQGIIFYDNIKVASGTTDLECANTLYNYSFDIVVWVNTKRVVLGNNEFCSKEELIYNQIIKCLYPDKDVISIGLPAPYMRSGWKFKDCVKYLNSPYVAFRIPIVYQYNLCAADIADLEYTIQDC